ncbi:MAG: DUF4214 domain-containing protein [Actinobacteria bacterium]|nr:DUF4214 domain-containing protein [Actinomycetota bacterium]
MTGAVVPARAGQPGRLESSVVTLAGPSAAALAPAAGDVARLRAAGRTDAESPRRTTGAATRGWSGAIDVTDGTQMVAFTWSGAADGAVEVRSREGGRWSTWTPAAASPDEGPDTGGNGRTGVGPVWLGSKGADRVEVRVARAGLRDLRMRAMRWIEPVAGTGPQPAGAEPVGPGIRPRSDWAPGGWVSSNAGCPAAPEVQSQLKFAVVHHTASSNDYTPSQVPGILAGSYLYQVKDLGWCDMAYNFLVDKFGTIWQGRSGDIGLPIMGGHSKGFNTDSMGVALIGQYQPGESPAAAPPTAAEFTALRELLAWKLWMHRIDPLGTVTVVSRGNTKYRDGTVVTLPTIGGHRDNGYTADPGDPVYARLPQLRLDVKATIAAAGVDGARWAPFASPQQLASRQYADFLRRPATNTDAAYWATLMVRSAKTPAGQTGRLLRSAEMDNRIAPVVRLYLSAFLRAPDHRGFVWWRDQILSGKQTLLSMADFVTTSSEFRRRYGSLGNLDFVRRVYLNVLGRPADAGGLDYWADQLTAGRSRGWVLLGFSEAQEFKRASRAQVDVDLVTESMLGRTPTQAGLDRWAGQIRSGTSVIEDLIALDFASVEYRRRITGA